MTLTGPIPPRVIQRAYTLYSPVRLDGVGHSVGREMGDNGVKRNRKYWYVYFLSIVIAVRSMSDFRHTGHSGRRKNGAPAVSVERRGEKRDFPPVRVS